MPSPLARRSDGLFFSQLPLAQSVALLPCMSLHDSPCHPASCSPQDKDTTSANEAHVDRPSGHSRTPSSPSLETALEPYHDSMYRAPRARHEAASPCLLQLSEITPMRDKHTQPCKLLLQQTYEDAQRLPCSLSPHTFVMHAPSFFHAPNR